MAFAFPIRYSCSCNPARAGLDLRGLLPNGLARLCCLSKSRFHYIKVALIIAEREDLPMRTAAPYRTTHDYTTLPLQRSRFSRRIRRLGLWVGFACSVILLSLPDMPQAQVADPGIDIPSIEARQPAVFEISAGVDGRAETDIDGGGDVEELRVPVRLGYSTKLSDTWRLGVRASYMYDHFDFSKNGFGDPWKDVHLVRFALPLTYRLSARWNLLFAPILAISAESGADMGESITGGAAAGFVYTASPSLSLGLAIGVLSQIEDDASFLILPIIHWQIMPKITLRTEMDVSRGYGGTLAYNLASIFQLKGGLSFQRNRFRLNTSDRVGEASGVPLWGSVVFAPSEHFSIEWYTGMILAGSVRLEDDDGDKIRDKDLDDPQFFFGLTMKGAF